MHLNFRHDDDILEAELAGEWRGIDLPVIDAELAAQSLAGVRTLRIAIPDSVPLDLAGAWRLRDWIKQAEAAGVNVELAGEPPGQLTLIESTEKGQVHAAPRSSRTGRSPPALSAMTCRAARQNASRCTPKVGDSPTR